MQTERVDGQKCLVIVSHHINVPLSNIPPLNGRFSFPFPNETTDITKSLPPLVSHAKIIFDNNICTSFFFLFSTTFYLYLVCSNFIECAGPNVCRADGWTE